MARVTMRFGEDVGRWVCVHWWSGEGRVLIAGAERAVSTLIAASS